MNFTFDNPEEAYSTLSRYVMSCGVTRTSRNGDVVAMQHPVMVCFAAPNYRVLLNPERRANPFFHLAEALWMLSGRNDTDYVSRFNSNIVSYSDDGEKFNAAYGHRWVNHFGYNQIIRAVDMLTRNPDDRRVVISMWDPYTDLGSGSKDVPCNTQLMFSVYKGFLNMTSVNRSNDLIWGLMGANCVHLSILHEFMALATGNKLGVWHHMTNNLHIYKRHWDLARSATTYREVPTAPPLPLFYEQHHWEDFLGEVGQFVNGDWSEITLPFLRNVAVPMQLVWEAYKSGHKDLALRNCDAIGCPHWQAAARGWVEGASCQ